MTDAAPAAPPPRRAFWRRWLLDPVRRQLTQGVSPGKIALSIAVGSALALFPILGTTTTLCVLAGIVLGLNQPILQAVNAVCFPIYLPGVVAFIRLGDWLTGSSAAGLDVPVMLALASHHPREFLRQFGATAAHAVYGWAVVAPFWIAAVFLVLRPILQAAARRLPVRP